MALLSLEYLFPILKNNYENSHRKHYPSDFYFPIAGYNALNIGGENGNGYIASGYDYFDGNKHGGHPAQDIFIHDSNQDCKDDLTQKPVCVL